MTLAASLLSDVVFAAVGAGIATLVASRRLASMQRFENLRHRIEFEGGQQVGWAKGFDAAVLWSERLIKDCEDAATLPPAFQPEAVALMEMAGELEAGAPCSA